MTVALHPAAQTRGKIVVADDDDATRMILSQILKRKNFNVIAVENGKLACEAVRREHPDVVLMDCMMPVMNGRAALHELKASHETRAIPIMMLTTQEQVAEKVGALADGAQDYLTKPFDAQELIARIEQQMGWRSLLKTDADSALQTERATLLADGERRCRMLAEAMPQMVWLTGPDGAIDYCNRAWQRYTGTDAAEMRDGGWFLLVHPADRTRCARVWATSLATGEPYEIEYRIRRASDGMQRWHAGRATPVRDAQNKIVGWVGSCTDIHDFKIASEMSEAFAAIPHIVSIHDDSGFVDYLNPHWKTALGTEPESGLGFGWRAATHPDDAVDIATRLAEADAMGTRRRMPDRVIRMRAMDGRYTPFLTRTTALPDRSSRGRRWLTTSTDMGESIAAQVAIAAAERGPAADETRYRALIAAMPQLVWILDADDRVIFANQRWSDYTAVALDENLAQSAGNVIDADSAATIDAMRRLEPATEFACEARLLRADGVSRWHLVTGVPFPDAVADAGKWILSATDIDERKTAELQAAAAAAKLTRLAHYDEVTGLANRQLVMDRLAEGIALARRRACGLIALFVDLDRFKAVNDTYGHAAGDVVLAEVGRRFSTVLRIGDTAGRVGGDEFLLICAAGDRPADESVRLADRLLAAITRPIDFAGTPLTVGASIGIALYPDDAVDAEDLIRRADKAMYTAKRGGRNASCRYDANAAD